MPEEKRKFIPDECYLKFPGGLKILKSATALNAKGLIDELKVRSTSTSSKMKLTDLPLY